MCKQVVLKNVGACLGITGQQFIGSIFNFITIIILIKYG
jgi:hypothetical protein